MHVGHLTAWWVAGICAAYACFLSIQLVRRHLKNYTKPGIQNYIIRIIIMVPVYAIGSWLSLRYKEHALHIDLVRDCYEAFVIYSFVWMMTAYAGGDVKLLQILSKQPPMAHMYPMKLFYPAFKLDRSFVRKYRRHVLQYVIVKPVMTSLAILLDNMGVLGEGEWRMDRGYLYITIINSISLTVAMNGLLYFYHALSHELQQIRPLLKFLCIKAILFLSTWQGVLVAILANVHVIKSTASYTVEEVETGLQDFLLCFEMLIVAFAHNVAYSEKEFVQPAMKDKTKPDLWRVLGSALSVRTTLSDVYNAFSDDSKRK